MAPGTVHDAGQRARAEYGVSWDTPAIPDEFRCQTRRDEAQRHIAPNDAGMPDAQFRDTTPEAA